MKIIESIGKLIIEVGCKRIVTIMVVGTWSVSQLLKVGVVLMDKAELASQIGVTQEFGSLALFIAGSYFGYSMTKNGGSIK